MVHGYQNKDYLGYWFAKVKIYQNSALLQKNISPDNARVFVLSSTKLWFYI